MIGVTAAMIVQLLPAVIAVTIPMGRLRLTKMGITAGIIVGLIVSLMALLGGKVFPLGGFAEIIIPKLLPASWTRFDASFLGLAFNIPLALIVSQFTKAPDPEAVARIHGALDEEFGRRP